MVQQLSLWGSVAASEVPMTLKVLAATTGMTPRELDEAVLVWEPANPFKPTLAAGEVNQIEQYRVFARSHEAGAVVYSSATIPQLLETPWLLEVQEVPEAGRGLKVILQQVFQTRVTEGDPFSTLSALGYQYKKQFWLKGYEVVRRNVVIQLFQAWVVANETAATDSQNSKSGPELKLVDSSETWTCKAYVDVQNVTDLSAIEVATSELEVMQQDLRGILPLELPSRHVFDTRIR